MIRRAVRALVVPFALLGSVFLALPANAQDDPGLPDEFCALYPITIPATLVESAAVGTLFEGVRTDIGNGNFSWLTWTGDPSAPVLAESLIPPGNSHHFVNPDDPADSLLEIGDWVQGSPGATNSRAVREALTALLDQPIIIPVYSQTRANGNLFDYEVVSFAVIRLHDFDLSGQSWITFTYDGEGSCYNEPPEIVSTPIHFVSEDSVYDYDVDAVDPDNDPLTYSLVYNPTGMTIDPVSGLINWQPGADYTQSMAEFNSQCYVIPDDLFTVGGTEENPVYIAPLFHRVRTAISDGSDYAAPQTQSWDSQNDCLGCHVQNQTLLGLQASREKAEVDEAFAEFMLNKVLNSQLSDGTIRRSHPQYSKNQTAFALWALSYVPDRERTLLVRARALNYFSAVKSQSSAGTYWNNDHPSGWLNTQDAATALVALGASRYLTDVNNMQGLSAEELAVAADYTVLLPDITDYLLSRSRTDTNNIQLALRQVGLAEVREHLSDASQLAAVETAIIEIDDVLRARQRSDGGWSYIGTTQASDPLTSAWVGFALDYQAPPLSDEVVRNNIEFLLEAQRADGTWHTTSGLFATRLATTGLVMAYLPVALEFLGNPDVTVHAIRFNELTGSLTADVSNRGLADLTAPIEVQFYSGDPALGNLLGTEVISGLDSEEMLTAAIPASEPQQDIFVVLAAAPETPECEVSNNQASAALARVEVTDGNGGYDQQAFLVNVEDVNEPPFIISQPVTRLHLGSEYDYVVSVFDRDVGDAHEFALEVAPPGLFVNIRTGRVSYDFQNLPVGDHQVTISATDLRGLSAQQTYTLTVDENLAPEFTSEPVLDVSVGERYYYDADATDPDGGPIIYTLRVSPLTMTIHPDTGVIDWIPETRHVGAQPVQVVATDEGGAEAVQVFTVLVDQNRAPVFTSEPGYSVVAGQAYSYAPTVVDPDGDSFGFSLGSAPAGMQVNATTGVVDWTPTTADLGEHEVEILVTDTQGAVGRQVYPLFVLSEPNQAPHITSTPPEEAPTVGVFYYYDVEASDPDNDLLTYTLLTAPAGMTIEPENGAISWTPAVDQAGQNEFAVQVSDGRGGFSTQTVTFTVISLGNNPPQILSTPPFGAIPGQPYSYPVIAVDPDGDPIAYSLSQAPAGMSVSASGVVSWTPAASDLGSHTVAVAANDGRGATVTQTYTLTVSEAGANQAPGISSVPPLSARAGLAYSYQVVASDPENDPLTYSLVSGPTGMSMNASGLVSWTPSEAGEEDVSVSVSDGTSTATQSWTIYVSDGSTPLGVLALVDPEVTTLGQTVTITVVPQGAAGAVTLSATVDGTPISLDQTGRGQVVASAIGSHELVATVTDAYGSASATSSFFVLDPSDSEPPIITISGIEDDQEITAPVDAVISVEDDNLNNWVFGYVGRGTTNNQFVQLAGGTTPVTGEVVEIDPTLMMNGQYALVAQAIDNSGNVAADSRLVRVTGDLKVGNFTITFEDLQVPVSGIPITVNRTYDSRRRNEDLDFGFGWSIDYQNVQVNESRTPGLGWEIVETRSGPFGAFVTFCVMPSGAPIVTVTLPDGAVEEFEAYASPECNDFLPLIDVELKFRPIDGSTLSTLEQNDYPLLRLINGNLSDIEEVNIPANPQRYTLTTKAGYVYELDQGFGVKEVEDPNGNTLTYTDNGIFHSDGKSVLFNRDGGGRITEIIDPNNNVYHYDYDGAGDLVAATDPTDAEVSFTYNLNHGLLDIIDPLGRRIVRNIYDDDNRLIAQEDNEGNRTEFNHDIDAGQTIVTDRLGRISFFTYDDEGNVLSQVDPAGGVTSFTYDGDGNQLSQTDPLGNTTTATYNDRRDQLTQTDALGNTVSFSYNQFGQELTVEDARGNVYDNTYDPFGNLLGVEDPLGNIAAQNINAKGLVSLRRDAEGNETTFTYDSDGNVLTETDPLGNVTTNIWDANGNKLSESRTRTLADGSVVTETTSYTYDERNRLLTTTDPLGNVTSTEYDLLGREVARVDALGRRTEMEYDVFGRLVETRYPDGTSETRSYDKEGNLLTETDRLGRTTTHVYDLLDREIETIYPDDTPGTDADNPRTFTEYDAAGRVTAEIDANGNRTEYGYDAAGRRTSTTDALGNVFLYDYDEDGNQVAQTDAGGFTTTHSYDALNRRTQTTYPDSSTTQTEYDALERVTAEIDQNGIRTEYAYDELGRLIEVTDALGGVTAFSYDEVGNKRTQTDAEGRTTEWEYDALGRATARILPLGQVEVMGYDAVGNRTAMSDFNGDATTYSYDVMDRLERADYHDGSFETHTYDNLGRRTATTHRYGSESWTYDVRGRLQSHTDIHGNVLNYAYDAQGNRTAVTGPSGTVAYTFDALNRLKTVDDGAVTTYQYDANGNTSKVLFPNGTETGYVYDSQNRLTRVDHADTVSGILFDQQLYDLAPSGHRERITELSGRVVDYIYDDLYRLVEEQTSDSLIGNRITSFTYDAVGNRLTRVDDGVSTSYSYDANDRLSSETTDGVTTSYSYDSQGNTLAKTTSGSSTSYAYDPNHRLLGADDGANIIGFAYDASGVRVARDDNGGSTLYVVDHNRDYAQVLEEQDAFGGTLTTYTYGHDLLSQDQGVGNSYFHYDGLGSTRKLTNASGAVTDSYIYKAFGAIEAQNGSTDNAYLFTGEQYDDGLAQYYLRARYYDPASGRFTQMDTFMGVNRNPVTLHKYLYANASPGMFVDPSGAFGLLSLSIASSTAASMATGAQPGYSSLLFSGTGSELSERQRGALILATLSFGSSRALLLQMYKISEKRNDLSPSTRENQLLQQGDIEGYYAARLARGDGYATTALQVVQERGVLGTSANAWLLVQVLLLSASERDQLLRGGTYGQFVKRVRMALARRHNLNSEQDRIGIIGLLSANQISAYHENYFMSEGLPRNTFGGSVFGFRTAYWCVGCDLLPQTQ